MRDFIQRLIESRQRASDPILDATRERNAALVNNAYPGGVPAYQEANPPRQRATSTPAVPRTDPMMDTERARNEQLVNSWHPGGTAGYQADRQAQRAANPELDQQLFGNPYVNLFNRLFKNR